MDNTKTIPMFSAKDIPNDGITAKQISEGLYQMQNVNPNYKDWYEHKTHRKAMRNVMENIGYEKTLRIIKWLPKLNATKWGPPITTTPSELKGNIPKIIAWLQRERSAIKSKEKEIII